MSRISFVSEKKERNDRFSPQSPQNKTNFLFLTFSNYISENATLSFFFFSKSNTNKHLTEESRLRSFFLSKNNKQNVQSIRIQKLI